MPIYAKPVRLLTKDMADGFALQPGQSFTGKQAIDWFEHHYPKIRGHAPLVIPPLSPLVSKSSGRYDTRVAGANALHLALEIARLAADMKAEDVVALDLRGVTAVTDFTVIATGSSDRQIRAMAEAVIEYGRKIGDKPYGVCGHENAIWIVVDFVDVVFHIFAKPYRDYYDLELLWGDAPRLQWMRSESA